MPERLPNALPQWVIQRDGGRVPFEPDEISQAIFAGLEHLGRPDAFLARELTDGVLHFLALETHADPPSTQQIAELTIKVIRELGQPDVAQALEAACAKRWRSSPERAASPELPIHLTVQTPPAAIAATALCTYSLHAIYSRDLRAAAADGFLELGGLTTPELLASATVEATGTSETGIIALEDIVDVPATTWIVDIPRASLVSDEAGERISSRLPDLHTMARAMNRTVLVNVNSAPSRASVVPSDPGPLFADEPALPPAASGWPSAKAFLDACSTLDRASAFVQVNCHVCEEDLEDGQCLETLLRMCRDKPWLALALDRRGQDIALGPGVDRRRPAVILVVGLGLPRLLDFVDGDVQRFLDKLPSLARMAVRTGAQKRAFLRRSPANARLSRGFLLDRARLLAVPIGLDAVVHRLLGQGIAQSKIALALGKQIIETIWRNLLEGGRMANLDVALDAPRGRDPGEAKTAHAAPGICCGPYAAPWKYWLHACATLREAAGPGGIELAVYPDFDPLALGDALRASWKKFPNLSMVHFSRQHSPVSA